MTSPRTPSSTRKGSSSQAQSSLASSKKGAMNIQMGPHGTYLAHGRRSSAPAVSNLSNMFANLPHASPSSDPTSHSPASPASSSLSASLPSSLVYNEFEEHWQVLTKESARKLEASSPSTFLSEAARHQIVTFPPSTYVVVNDAEVGQNAWFKAQRCTCTTYFYGFARVRRPATIREHLSKQPCAPIPLATMADIQLRLMRNSSSQFSVGSSKSSSASPIAPNAAVSLGNPSHLALESPALASTSATGLDSGGTTRFPSLAHGHIPAAYTSYLNDASSAHSWPTYGGSHLFQESHQSVASFGSATSAGGMSQSPVYNQTDPSFTWLNEPNPTGPFVSQQTQYSTLFAPASPPRHFAGDSYALGAPLPPFPSSFAPPGVSDASGYNLRDDDETFQLDFDL